MIGNGGYDIALIIFIFGNDITIGNDIGNVFEYF